MVLGIQWLETLGAIQRNFKTLTMDFKLNGKRYVLRGGQVNRDVEEICIEICIERRYLRKRWINYSHRMMAFNYLVFK